tara:strand:- start:10728 stop:12419 length:1692 start_codon:yes stop_codon:yes gene_type:complete
LDPATKYAEDVVNGKQAACRFVRLACERHLKDLEKKDWPYYWSPEAAARFYKFTKYLKHYKGQYAGQVFELLPWQYFVFGSIYGWLKKETDEWRFNFSYIEIPRKNGKTTMLAGAALYDSAFIERTGCETYCVATKEDQAKLLFSDAVQYVRQSEELQAVYEHLTGRSTLFVSNTGRSSFLRPVGSDSRRLDGLNPLAIYADELHNWGKNGGDLWAVFAQSFGARSNYHMISITTAGYDREGICYQERAHLIRILENQIDAENKFGVIYTCDEEDEEKWNDEKTWFIANPNLNQGKELAYMKQQAKKVAQVPSTLSQFMNKELNIWTDTASQWLRTAAWDACENKQLKESDLYGLQCYGGMDLARVNDLSACAYFFPVQKGLGKATVLVDFFIPEHDLKLREDRDGVPYGYWAAEHSLTLTLGKTTDWDFIKESILTRYGQFNVLDFGYDRHFAGELVSSLEREGKELKGFGMGFVSMASPTSEFERLVVGGELQHLGDPVLKYNLANCTISLDAAGNKKPDKAKSSGGRIDGLVAAIVALGMYLNQDKPKETPYEDRGLRVL